MTVTTAETLSVNGVILNTLAYNIESLTGRLKMPKYRTENIEVAGRHGGVRTREKKFEQNQIILPMWVRGCNADGSIPSDSTARREFFKNLDILSRLFLEPNGNLLDIRHTLPDGSVRQCFGEVTEQIDFSTVGANPRGRFSVAISIPDVFWQDVDITMIPNNTPVSPTLLTLASLAGSTAPIEDATFFLNGPITNGRVEAYYNNAALSQAVWFQYNGSIASGQTLTVDCKNWILSGGGGLVVNYSNFNHSGSARWMTLIPGPAGAGPQINVTGSAFTGSSNVGVWAYRKFLVG